MLIEWIIIYNLLATLEFNLRIVECMRIQLQELSDPFFCRVELLEIGIMNGELIQKEQLPLISLILFALA